MSKDLCILLSDEKCSCCGYRKRRLTLQGGFNFSQLISADLCSPEVSAHPERPGSRLTTPLLASRGDPLSIGVKIQGLQTLQAAYRSLVSMIRPSCSSSDTGSRPGGTCLWGSQTKGSGSAIDPDVCEVVLQATREPFNDQAEHKGIRCGVIDVFFGRHA